MSIPDIQRQMVLGEAARFYFSNGEKPLMTNVLKDVSSFFAKNPIGRPFPVESNNIRANLVSDVDEVNDNIMRSILNMSILYEAIVKDMEKSMSLYTVAQARLANLKTRRDKIESDIDDFLLTTSNSEGYFYSFSDYFSTANFTDLTYTSAFVDVLSGQVSIPPVSQFSRVLSKDDFSLSSVRVLVDGNEVPYQTDSSFEGAVDGLSNTNWSFSTFLPELSEVTVELKIQLNANSSFGISKIEIDPFTVIPVQVGIQTEDSLSESGVITTKRIFGESIKSSAHKMTFIDNERRTSFVYVTMRKTQPDYELQTTSSNRYAYVFGASHLEISKQSYDNSATFVSNPISLPSEIASDHVIDAIVLAVDDSVVANTSIKYYVAADNTTATELGDFPWNRVIPLEESATASGATLRFDGASNLSKHIRDKDIATSNELKLIDFDSTNTDLSKRNPTTVVVNGIDIYRIAEFKEDYIPQSLSMEEGLNSTRILSVPLDSTAAGNLTFWADYINGTLTASEYYGRIDTGNEFFYGGDIGVNNRSIYVETYVESLSETETLIKEFRKSDDNSKQWEIYVYLNGRKIGSLPSGTDTALLPWKFNEGLNHVALTINIPAATDAYPSPYLGSVSLMVQEDLNIFGTVRLANWTYVDFFRTTYNETGQPKTFTISDGEIISRRRPTTNFRLHYTKPTGRGVDSIRLRADLERTGDNDSVTPVINDYSIRFSYGDGK